MKLFSFKLGKYLLLFFLSVIFGVSLTILVLLNLPFFYELDKPNSIKIFLIVSAIFSMLILLSKRFLSVSLEYIRRKDKSSIAFFIIMTVVLGSAFYFLSPYYWTIPTISRIDICYKSNNPIDTVNLFEINDLDTNRLYPPESLGYNTYPIQISSGKCAKGRILALLRKNEDWQGVAVVLEEKENGNFVQAGINEKLNTFPLVDTDGILQKETIPLQTGTGMAEALFHPWGGNSLALVKWISLFGGSVYLGLFLFGITELLLDSNRKIVSHKVGLVIVLLYFFIFGCLMIFHGGQPDQKKHTYFSHRYSETWGFPNDDPESEFFIKDNVYFYYWINGAASKLLHLLNPNTKTSTDRFLWCLISVFISTATLLFVYKLTFRLTGNRWGGILAAFFGANTLMFVFISGGVSFDNFMSLSSAAALYHFVCTIKGDDYVKHTALMGIWLSLGSLSKNQVVLLAFILFVVWLFYSWKNRKKLEIRFSRLNYVLLAILLLTFGLFLELYVGNLIQYHKPLPSCKQIKSAELCTRFSYRVSQRLELNFIQLWFNRNEATGPFEYLFNFWLLQMLRSIWGIISHNTFIPKFFISLHSLLIIWAMICIIRYWQKNDIASTALMMIVLMYTGYVFQMNFISELRYSFRHYAVQGRYLFPVLSAFFALMVNYVTKLRPLFLRRLTISLAIVIYFGGGLGMFIFRYSEIFAHWRVFY